MQCSLPSEGIPRCQPTMALSVFHCGHKTLEFQVSGAAGGPGDHLPPEEEAGNTKGDPFCRSLSFTLCGHISWSVGSRRCVFQVWGWHFSFSSSSFWERVPGPGLLLWVSLLLFSSTSQKHGALTGRGQNQLRIHYLHVKPPYLADFIWKSP